MRGGDFFFIEQVRHNEAYPSVRQSSCDGFIYWTKKDSFYCLAILILYVESLIVSIVETLFVSSTFRLLHIHV